MAFDFDSSLFFSFFFFVCRYSYIGGFPCCFDGGSFARAQSLLQCSLLPCGVVQKTAVSICCVMPFGHNFSWRWRRRASCRCLELVVVRHFNRVGLCKRLQQVYAVQCLLIITFLGGDVVAPLVAAWSLSL